MSQLIKIDKEYTSWIEGLSTRFRTLQIKAAIQVNQDMLMFYWSMGKDIVAMNVEEAWGTGILNNLSLDLTERLLGSKAFSETNLDYMKRFFWLYSNTPLAVANNPDEIPPQLVGKLSAVPWGHHQYIMDKCDNDGEKALFYVDKTLENNWSRAALLNGLVNDLYKEQGKTATNSGSILPEPQGDLAMEITKDPYNFDFLFMREGINEKEIKEISIGTWYRLCVCR